MVRTKIFGHEHLVLVGHIADRMVPVIAKLLYKAGFRNSLAKILRTIFFWTPNDDLDRIANFLISIGKTPAELFKELKSYGNKKDEFVIITIDLEFAKRGKVKIPYEQQIQDVCDLIDSGEPIKLFIHIDPRRENYMHLINKYESYISGIKMYNYMGYFPYDIRLQPLWKRCEVKNWPVVFHCSRGNINYYGGRDIDKILKRSLFPLLNTGKSNREKSMNFSNPIGMIKVAKDNPGVNFIIEHLGGKEDAEAYWRGEENTWTGMIIESCLALKNLYIGTSFTSYTKPMYYLIRYIYSIIPDKIIWGTDFNVNKSVTDMKSYIMLKTEIGIQAFYHIANNIRKILPKN